MGCSCAKSPSNSGGDGGKANYNPPSNSRPSVHDAGESSNCYMKRAGDPKNSPAGEPTKATTSKKITSNLKLINNNIPITQILLRDDNSVNVIFTLDSPTDIWTYNWTKTPLSNGSTGITFVQNNDTLIMSGEFNFSTQMSEGVYVLKISAYYQGSLQDQQVYNIRAFNRTNCQSFIFNMPFQANIVPTILCNYGINYNTDYTDYVYYNSLITYTSDRPHYGVDLTTIDNNPVVVNSCDGIICEYDNSPDYGNYILIRHNSNINGQSQQYYLYTLYAHLNTVYLTNNDIGRFCPSGQPLGIMGDTGLVDFPNLPAHLHFEIRASRINCNSINAMLEYETFDPMILLRGNISISGLNTLLDDTSNTKAASPATSDNTTAQPASTTSSDCQKSSSDGPATPIVIDPSLINSDDITKYFLAAMIVECSPAYWPNKANDPYIVQGCPGGAPIVRPAWLKCGYTKDCGGLTKYGVAEAGGHSAATIASLVVDQAKQIFASSYAPRYNALAIPDSTATSTILAQQKCFVCVFIAQIYQGYSRAVRAVRKVIGANQHSTSPLSSADIPMLRSYIATNGIDTTISNFFAAFFAGPGPASSDAQKGAANRISELGGACKKFFLGT